MDIKVYNDALASQQDLMSNYISKNVADIVVPESKKDLSVGKSNFLTKSGWVYNVIGILAFIIGLIVKIPGIWLTGCAGLTAGFYCIFKGKQQLRQEAYDNVGNELLGSLDKVIAYVSKSWGNFVTGQNLALRKDIVDSSLDTENKAKMLAFVADTGFVHVDLAPIDKSLSKIDSDETLGEYKDYLPVAEKQLQESLKLAVKAQSDIYNAVDHIANPTSAPTPTSTSAPTSAPTPNPQPSSEAPDVTSTANA